MKTAVMVIMAVIMNLTGTFTNIGAKLDAMVTNVETKVETVGNDVKTIKYVEKNFMGKGDEDEHYIIYRLEDGKYRIIYGNKAMNHTDQFRYMEIADYDPETDEINYLEVMVVNKMWTDNEQIYASESGFIDDTMTKLIVKR